MDPNPEGNTYTCDVVNRANNNRFTFVMDLTDQQIVDCSPACTEPPPTDDPLFKNNIRFETDHTPQYMKALLDLIFPNSDQATDGGVDQPDNTMQIDTDVIGSTTQ